MNNSHLRDAALLQSLRERARLSADGRPARFMHLCGTHEYTVCRYGLRAILPPGVEVIGGPGCPVCVCPSRDIEQAIHLSKSGAIVTTFGDMVRVPSDAGSLADARMEGGDVRVVGSITAAIEIARENPARDVVFLAVGFETTACTFAAAVLEEPPENFSLLTSIRLIPPATAVVLGIENVNLDGIILPGHVCTIIGLAPFAEFVKKNGIAMAVAGFEPVDFMLSVVQLLDQLGAKTPRCDNAYKRLVRWDGNPIAVASMQKVFEATDAVWRGIGAIPGSGLTLRPEYSRHDARARFGLETSFDEDAAMPKGCDCGLVLTGQCRPQECRSYGKTCTPEKPRGPCMISHEGSCRIAWECRDL